MSIAVAMLGPEGAARAEARYAERIAVIDAEVARCRYCKAAKTRKAKHPHPEGRPAECERHGTKRRTTYLSSPLSEHYWCS